MRADVARIFIAIPHAAEKVGGISDKPAVGIGVGGTRFSRHRERFL